MYRLYTVKLNELSPRDMAMIKASLLAASTTATTNHPSDTPSPTPPPPAAALEAGVYESDWTEDREEFVALGRVFSGTMTRNSNLYAINHRHEPLDPALLALTGSGEGDLVLDGDVPECYKATVTRIPVNSFGLYLCLGPSVTPVDEVSAGNIVAIVGIDQIVLKTATICTTWAAAPLKPMVFQAKPMVRVAVEPKSHQHLSRLEQGLAMLYQYDPAVEINLDSSGQHTLSCLGELHLEQCLKSLAERFAK